MHEDSNARRRLDRDVLLRKARGWNYEKEYRLLGLQGDQESPLRLKEITFGLRCPMSVVHTVTKALAGRAGEMRYFQMFEARGRFVLRRSEVNLVELGMYMPRTAQSGEEVFGNHNEVKLGADGDA